MVAHEVLEDHADVRAQLGQVVLAEVVPVEQDAPLVRIVEARQQLDERRLAGAVLADQASTIAVCSAKCSGHRPRFGARVDEAGRPRSGALADRAEGRTRVLGRVDIGLDREEGEQVVEVERFSRRRREALRGSRQSAQAAERAGEERSGSPIENCRRACEAR
jgi:hypothetical protein